MTINGVEQDCIKSQSIVCLLDVMCEGFEGGFSTATEYVESIKDIADKFSGNIYGAIRKILLSVINDSLTTAEHYIDALGDKMSELRGEINGVCNSKSNS